MGQTLTRLIQKVTYSPDVDKELNNQNAAARDKRELFKNKIATQKTNVAARIKKIATVVNEKYKKRISDANAWLDSNRNARPLDIDNQIVLFTNDCATIEATNEGNLFYERVLALADLQAAANNKITSTVNSERTWYNKNKDLPLKEYTQRKTSVFDPAVVAAGGSAIDISRIETVDIIGHQAVLKKKKKQLEVEPSLWDKMVTTFFSSLWSLFYIAVLLAGGSLGANLMVHRPVPYRILAFIYGCLASPLLILYSIFGLMKSDPIIIYSMFIPIFQAAPTNYLTFFSYSEDDKLKQRKDAYVAQGIALVKATSAIAAATNAAMSSNSTMPNTAATATAATATAATTAATAAATAAFGNENSVNMVGNAFGNENSVNMVGNAFGNENTNNAGNDPNPPTTNIQLNAGNPLNAANPPNPVTAPSAVKRIPATQKIINGLHANLDKNVAARKKAEELVKLAQTQSLIKALEIRDLARQAEVTPPAAP